MTSFGIICYRIKFDEDTQVFYPEYLMVQRKDSLSYVEFIRGKYDVEKRTYILKLFSNMTQQERDDIGSLSFQELWKNLWQVENCNAFYKEYQEAKVKFDILKAGFMMDIDSPEECSKVFFDINYILENSESNLYESEWGFPKGRRNINERDFQCAIREFREETGIDPRCVKIPKDLKPFDEIFTGSNHVRYRHVYYLACYCIDHPIKQDNPTPIKPPKAKQKNSQIREIRDVKWFTYNDVQAHILDHNVERKELFRRVNAMVMKNLSARYNE